MEKKGNFKFRSAYRMLVQTKFVRESWLEGAAASSRHEQDSKDWVSLWDTQVPSKTRYLWRLAMQSLPTNDVRVHRNMASTPAWTLCGMADSWRHLLLECSMSRCAWVLADGEMFDRMISNSENDARNWLFPLKASL